MPQLEDECEREQKNETRNPASRLWALRAHVRLQSSSDLVRGSSISGWKDGCNGRVV
jgi:hypothetical protein